MPDYDTWLTTPPDDRGYCPCCYASADEATEVRDDDGLQSLRCDHCGTVYERPMGEAEMLPEARWNAKLDRADL